VIFFYAALLSCFGHDASALAVFAYDGCCEYSKIAEYFLKCWISNLKFEKSPNFEFEIWKFTELSKFQMSNLKIHRISNLGKCQIFKIWNLKNHQISNLKIIEFLKSQIELWKNRQKHVLSKLNYAKTVFLKEQEKKQCCLVWLFQKQKQFKNQIKPFHSAFRIKLHKNSFSKRAREKTVPFGLTFSKAKAI
jgi:hypothetical protein